MHGVPIVIILLMEASGMKLIKVSRSAGCKFSRSSKERKMADVSVSLSDLFIVLSVKIKRMVRSYS